MLEWRLGVSKVINYKGDLSQPPGTITLCCSLTHLTFFLVDAKVKQQTSILSKKHGIRSSELDVDTDEELFGDD